VPRYEPRRERFTLVLVSGVKKTWLHAVRERGFIPPRITTANLANPRIARLLSWDPHRRVSNYRARTKKLNTAGIDRQNVILLFARRLGRANHFLRTSFALPRAFERGDSVSRKILTLRRVLPVGGIRHIWHCRVIEEALRYRLLSNLLTFYIDKIFYFSLRNQTGRSLCHICDTAPSRWIHHRI